MDRKASGLWVAHHWQAGQSHAWASGPFHPLKNSGTGGTSQKCYQRGPLMRGARAAEACEGAGRGACR